MMRALTLLYQIEYSLSPRLREQLIWSRFINVHGQPGKNIPMNLHMEHLTAIAKGAINNLGAGKTEKAVVRLGKAIGTISPVLTQFDEDNGLSSFRNSPCSSIRKGYQNHSERITASTTFFTLRCDTQTPFFSKLKGHFTFKK